MGRAVLRVCVMTLFFAATQTYAACYMGATLLLTRLDGIRTGQDQEVREGIKLNRDLRTNLESRSGEIQLGCFVSSSFALEFGHISEIAFATENTYRIQMDSGEQIVRARQEARGSATSASILWYEGEPSDIWRGFLRLRYVRISASGQGDLSYPAPTEDEGTEYLIGARTRRSESFFAPNVGISFRLSNQASSSIELGYSKRFLMLGLGIQANLF